MKNALAARILRRSRRPPSWIVGEGRRVTTNGEMERRTRGNNEREGRKESLVFFLPNLGMSVSFVIRNMFVAVLACAV